MRLAAAVIRLVVGIAVIMYVVRIATWIPSAILRAMSGEHVQLLR